MGRCHQYYDEFKQQGFGSVLLVFYWDPQQPDKFRTAVTMEMSPLAENRVVLASDLQDYFGSPVTELSLGFSEKDIQTIEHTRSLIQRIYADLGVQGEIEEEEATHWSHHHIGTCRMGDNPETSVVDRNLRVHESPNLYVAGSSTFVTSGAAHPTLAIAALSHRLAEHLTASYKAAKTGLFSILTA
jgi:choline dehydrogenase-like flavoprotein